MAALAGSNAPLSDALLHIADGRFRTFGGLSFAEFNRSLAEFVVAPMELTTVIERQGQEVARLLKSSTFVSKAIVHQVRRLEACALRGNQFLIVGDEERAVIASVYQRLLDQLALLVKLAANDLEKRLGHILRRHHERLAAVLRTLLESQMGETGQWSPPCHQYDPEFQLSLWDTKPAELQEPILDLGCGEDGYLVRYLRARGHEAWGLDRLGGQVPFVIQGDWLHVPLGRGQWGTIISHMAFSTHFLHHHVRKSGHPERYARRFMEILAALKPGGRFLYAPGLPFFETLLPRSGFVVKQRKIGVIGEYEWLPEWYSTEVRCR